MECYSLSALSCKLPSAAKGTRLEVKALLDSTLSDAP